jgi:hypothetical protein
MMEAGFMAASICNVHSRFPHPGGTQVVIFKGAMRRTLIAFAMLLTATAAFGGDSAPPPDYSRDAILKVLHETDVKEAPFRMYFGGFDINTRTTRFHLNYLPLLAPIMYAGPYGARFLPNPFVLTHTEYAWRPHQYKALPQDYEDDREYQREYKRVAKILKRQKIVVKTQ